MRTAICAIFIVCGVVAAALAQQAPPAAVPVGVVKAERKPIEKTFDFVGRVEAVNRVEIRARVQGFLEAVLFKEGDTIKEGDPLYRIEKGMFQAAVEQAEGALLRSKAAKTLTEAQLARAEDLLAKNAGTAVARDQAVAADEQAKGQILSDEASLQTAKINLGYTDIVTPVSGRIGRTNITKGNVVGPDSGPLTVVVSQDPMYVTFPVSQRELLKAREDAHQVDVRAIKAKLRFADGKTYDQTGQINFVDVTVDRATDTVLVRATFPNPDGALIDGQLVRVTLESGTPQEMVVVPQSALIADQEGVYVFVVEDGKAVVKRIKPGGESGTDAVVQDGLSGNEQIIVEGLQGVRPGIPVKASPVMTTLKRS
jgi:membrane fusion protein (multidrug efflux system)